MHNGGEINRPFVEVQQFRQPWLWVLLIIVEAGCLAALIPLIMRAQSSGEMPVGLVIVLITMLTTGPALLLLFLLLKMETRVDDEGITINFQPFCKRRISLQDIEQCEALQYRPIRNYGGWGLRWGWNGWAYNVRGNQGVQLVLTGNKRVLIGSQHAEELAATINARREGLRGK
ncbi:MAG: hypothetical protein KKB50_07280 [Planctomycetes bacterium]|nr:hypothetical protein [Planctomycetota bacterium]